MGNLLKTPRRKMPSSASRMNSQDDQVELDTAVCIPTEIEDEPFSLQSFLLPNNLSVSKVEELECDLDFYEKFSLVFLLYNSSELELAFQKLEVAYTAYYAGDETFFPVSQWAREHNGDLNWSDRLIEALCIIQNYKLVYKIGYSKSDVNLKYLPDNAYMSSEVDLMRKALYRVCEGLTVDKAAQLIDLVYEDITREQQNPSISPKKYSPEYLEISLLHWHSMQYVTLGSSSFRSEIDIQNLAKHLKVLEQEELCEYIKFIEKKYKPSTPESAFIATEPPGNWVPPPTTLPRVQDPSSHSIVSTYGGSRHTSSVYSIDASSVGLCLIINQKYFYEDGDVNLKMLLPHHKLETRFGTDIDESRLIETFTALGFEICEVGNNLTHTDIIEALTSAAKQFKKEHSCFVLCILSHGKKGAVYGSNSIPVDIQEIEYIISGKTYPNLLRKPKVIIIQACQGTTLQGVYIESDIEEDGLPARVPSAEDRTRSDLTDQIKFWSTVPGFASFRHPQDGTWFIEILTSELLLQEPQMDICAIFTKVNARLSERRAFKNDMWVGMTSQFSTTLTKTLYLPLHREARFPAAKQMLVRHMFKTMLDEFIRSGIRSESHQQYAKTSK